MGLAPCTSERIRRVSAAPLEAQIGDRLKTLKLTLAVAESCTGGWLGARLTSVPGSTAYFLGGIIAYANEVKIRLLNVAADVLAEQGAVSEAVAQSMAEGVRIALNADVGVGITGVAGPDGGTPDKPVGLVWIGLADRQRCQARAYRFTGDRAAVRQAAAQAALEQLADRLEQLA